MSAAGWAIEVHPGSAAELHGREVGEPAGRAVWWLTAAQPALVLGSSQRSDVVDEGALERTGVELVRRHSGGGAVLLVPGEVSWVDVVLPVGDPLWDADVGRAVHWLGSVWRQVASGFGVAGAEVHRGAMVRTPWSSLVCFAGLGPGEVQVAGRKLVGISQRRTRGWARFQCAVYRCWDPAALVELLHPPRPTAEELTGIVATLDVPDADLRAAFIAALP
jgi:lipoate---protein ligase